MPIFLRKRKEEISSYIKEKYGNNKIIAANINVSSFGQESKGLKQLRGNGCLVLSKDELYFEMFFPKKKWVIPMQAISLVEKTKTHLNKWSVFSLLKVNYLNPKGDIDSLAWAIKDVDQWIERIENLRMEKDFDE